jgi:hypothetical protein
MTGAASDGRSITVRSVREEHGMEAVRERRVRTGGIGGPALLIGVLLAVVITVAVIALMSRDDADSGAPAQDVAAPVVLPSTAQDAALLDENVNHPDVIGDGVIEGVGTIGNTDVAYPEGVLEATDVELNRAAALAVNPELISGVARTVFLEQNLMLPGDVGHLDDRVLSIEEIQFLEVNTFLPDGGSVAFDPPVDQRGGPGIDVTAH